MRDHLNVNIEIEGRSVYVGRLTGNDPLETRFTYDPDYIKSDLAAPISVRFPLQKESFNPVETRTFFEGLLPEGFTRKSVAKWMRIDQGDYLSMLHGLGRECLGAIMITDEEDEEFSSYEALSMDQVHELAAEGATKSAELVTKAHLSLTGASGKVGLYLDRASGNWYLPKGSAPSTHIVKQSHVRLNGIVTNEQLCLMTARKIGIDVPDCFIINIGGKDEGDVLFASERYDRVFGENCLLQDGLKVPYRLHQEDFSQAMGIGPQDKYEHSNAGYFRQMFEVLKLHSRDPIRDRLRLWDIVIFDYLIGNTDNHVKNVSLLYQPNLKSLSLAPAYDILSTAVYETSTREMGFAIGGKYLLDEIDRAAFKSSAKELGLGEKLAMNRFDALAQSFEKCLDQAAEELESKGFDKARPLQEKILTNSGYAVIR